MRFSLALDHLAVVCRTIEEGTAYVEAVLGAKMSPGGQHGEMGTHNTLLSLGPDAYPGSDCRLIQAPRIPLIAGGSTLTAMTGHLG